MLMESKVDNRIETFINSIEIDTWQELNNSGEYISRVRSIYCGDGVGDFEKRSYYTTIECLENYMVHCDDQMQLALADILNLKTKLESSA